MPIARKGKTGKIFAKETAIAELSEVIKWLGEEHFIETDSTRTPSGTERYWVFDVGEGLALAFLYSDITNELLIGTNQDGVLHSKLKERFIPSLKTTATQGVMWD